MEMHILLEDVEIKFIGGMSISDAQFMVEL